MLQPSFLRCCSMDHWQIPEKANIFGWGGETPAEVFGSWNSGSTVSTSPILSEQTTAKSVVVCIPNRKHLTFTFPSKALSQHCSCTSPRNEIDTGHLFLDIPNFFQSGSLKISVLLKWIRSRTNTIGRKNKNYCKHLDYDMVKVFLLGCFQLWHRGLRALNWFVLTGFTRFSNG